MTSESKDAYMCTEAGEKKKLKEVNSNMMLELKYEEVA